MTTEVDLARIAIVLVRPQIPENIGAAARAMNNMGLSKLILVQPKNRDLSRIRKTATGSSTDLIEKMQIHEDLLEALAPFHHVVGTTARTGSMRPAVMRPRSLAHHLIPISKNNHVAILFGPEDRGLSNEDLYPCHTLTTIPTAEFSSLNLAHAVLILSYEIFLASTKEAVEATPRLANGFELEGMYGHLREVLLKIGFLNPQNPEHWMRNIRRFLSRLPLRAREVRVVRGICRQIDWYTSQAEDRASCNRDGK